MFCEFLECGFGEATDTSPGFLHAALEEFGGQQRDICFSIAEWWGDDFCDLQPEVEIRAEQSVGNGRFEVAIGRRNDSHVHLYRSTSADAFERVSFEDPQEFGLDRTAHFADFVEEERSAVCLFKASDSSIGRASEGSFFVPEEFAFEETFVECGAVEADERSFALWAAVVDTASDQFLAAATFAADQDSGIGFGDQCNLFAESDHGGSLSDQSAGSWQLTSEQIVGRAGSCQASGKIFALLEVAESDGHLTGDSEAEVEIAAVERVFGVAGIEMNQSERLAWSADGGANDAECLHFAEAVEHGELSVIGDVACENRFAALQDLAGQVIGDSSVGQITAAAISQQLQFGGTCCRLSVCCSVGRDDQHGGDHGDRFTFEAGENDFGKFATRRCGSKVESQLVQACENGGVGWLVWCRADELGFGRTVQDAGGRRVASGECGGVIAGVTQSAGASDGDIIKCVAEQQPAGADADDITGCQNFVTCDFATFELSAVAAGEIPEFPAGVGEEDFAVVATGSFILEHQAICCGATDGGDEQFFKANGIAPGAAIPREQKGFGFGACLA